MNYEINANTGALVPVAGSPFATGVQPASVAVNPNGRFVYVADAGLDAGDISVYTINATTAKIAGSMVTTTVYES